MYKMACTVLETLNEHRLYLSVILNNTLGKSRQLQKVGIILLHYLFNLINMDKVIGVLALLHLKIYKASNHSLKP